ncbi:E2 domain-containing protein [Paraburkholderia fungorum]|uniref:Uncharacterized protein n=1 Tax=Paraburkholderia fungorum TaxID=134537 RepID=A0AAW3URI7_9BURK|nr:E2 domain-containing protein [Paraburkholderia fungorum]MBB4519742.1 hypothetical protein [Paraburkholderia fungorum]MBB6201229.1 hypothetical protein [Paraburkholderia fungorum]
MTAQAEDPIGHIVRSAAAYGCGVVKHEGASLLLDVPVPRLDGRSVRYQIEAVAKGAAVSAKEYSPVHLPVCCPNLHINPDASFCLSLKSEDPLLVQDADSAQVWWETLIQFLRLQERAARLRRWPDSNEWAHGFAARHQQLAQRAAKTLGDGFALALQQGRLDVAVVQSRLGAAGKMLRLYLDGEHIVSVWPHTGTVVNGRRQCPCPHRQRRVLVRHCAEHTRAIGELAVALNARRTAEAEFWAQLSGRKCCGRVETCGLRTPELRQMESQQ